MRVNNKIMEAKTYKVKAFDAATVMENAEENVDNEVPYNVLSVNCEHYVTKWRYGKAWSDQVNMKRKPLVNLYSKKY